MIVSDFKINSMVRGVLARHWVDLASLNFGSYQGTVRLCGELRYLGMRECMSAEALKVEMIENEIRNLQGVRRVHLDLINWRRNFKGAWEQRSNSRPFSKCRRY